MRDGNGSVVVQSSLDGLFLRSVRIWIGGLSYANERCFYFLIFQHQMCQFVQLTRLKGKVKTQPCETTSKVTLMGTFTALLILVQNPKTADKQYH